MDGELESPTRRTPWSQFLAACLFGMGSAFVLWQTLNYGQVMPHLALPSQQIQNYSKMLAKHPMLMCMRLHEERTRNSKRRVIEGLPGGLASAAHYWLHRSGLGPGSVNVSHVHLAAEGPNYSAMGKEPPLMQMQLCILVQVINRFVYVAERSAQWTLDHKYCDCARGRLHHTLRYVQGIASDHEDFPDLTFILCIGDASGLEVDVPDGVPYLAPTTTQGGRLAVPFPIRERSADPSYMLDLWPKIYAGMSGNVSFMGPPWNERAATAFFRGSNHGNRGNAFKQSEILPKLLDASGGGVSKGHFEQDGSYRPDPAYGHWKYALVLGGNGGWADRVMEDVFRRMVLLIVDEDAVDFFWPNLRSFEHFVPVDRDMQSLIPCILGLQRSDLEAQLIGEKMREFAVQELEPSAIREYSRIILYGLAKQLTGEIRLRNDSILFETHNWN